MRGWVLVCIFSVAVSFGSTVAAEPSLESSGTGFFVSYDGHVLTNYHVAQDCSLIRIVSLGAAPLNATVVAIDKSTIVRPNCLPARTRFTPAGSTNPIFCCPSPSDRQSCFQVSALNSRPPPSPTTLSMTSASSSIEIYSASPDRRLHWRR
jgi:hypothetical protein